MSPAHRLPADDSAECDGCALASAGRRAFLHDAALVVAGVLVSLGLGARTADALPVRAATVLGRALSDKRYAIPAADGVEIDRAEGVILARYRNAVYAFSLACPHQNTALRWEDDDHRFQCPKHHSQFTPDGQFIQGRATRAMDRFAIRREGDAIMVNLDALYQQDDSPDEWRAAVVNL